MAVGIVRIVAGIYFIPSQMANGIFYSGHGTWENRSGTASDLRRILQAVRIYLPGHGRFYKKTADKGDKNEENHEGFTLAVRRYLSWLVWDCLWPDSSWAGPGSGSAGNGMYIPTRQA